MITWIRRLFKLTLLLLCAWIIVTGMFFWAGVWGIYVVPPSKEKPKGSTWIVSREEDEPFFNAADSVLNISKKEGEATPSSKSPPAMTAEELAKMPKKPIDKRIIFKLPYWELLLEQAQKKE